jgi:hypothetical protein
LGSLVIFGLSGQIEGLLELVLEVIDQLNNSSGQFLVGILLSLDCQLSHKFDGFSKCLDVFHLSGLVGSGIQVGGNLSEHLWCGVDSFI